MRTIQKITIFTFMFLVANFIYAGQPSGGNPKVTSQKMVDKLDKDVQLTETQKAALQIKAEALIIQVKAANTLTDKNAQMAQKKQLRQAFKMAVDSILTDAQKAARLEKQEIRRKEVEESHK